MAERHAELALPWVTERSVVLKPNIFAIGAWALHDASTRLVLHAGNDATALRYLAHCVTDKFRRKDNIYRHHRVQAAEGLPAEHALSKASAAAASKANVDEVSSL